MSSKYVSLRRLSIFLDNLKNLFATKTEVTTATDSALETANTYTDEQVTSTREYIDDVLIGQIDGTVDLANYYTKPEVDDKILSIDMDIVGINTSIKGIVDGTTTVGKASTALHSDASDTADTATSSTSASQDGNGNVIVDTYETKADSTMKYDSSVAYTDEQVADLKEYTDNLFNSGTGGSSGDGTVPDHDHSDLYYDKSQVDDKILAVDTAIAGLDTSISNIVNGTTVVGKANESTHSTTSDEAASAIMSTQDANGNVIDETYETKDSSASKLAESKTYTDEQIIVAKEYADSLLSGAGVGPDHNHDDLYYTEQEIDEKFSLLDNTLSSTYETVLDSESKLEEAKIYTDTAMLAKANTTHIHEITDVNNLQSELDGLRSSIDSGGSPADGESPGTVKSGGDVNIENGIITVLDNSHNHTVDNIEGLYNILDSKSSTNHIHEDIYTKAQTDSLIADVNISVDEVSASVQDIIDGTTTVAKANQSSVAENANTSVTATRAQQDADGNIISDVYETKNDAQTKLDQAMSYADGIKEDLLNNAGEAYDTLKELGDLIDENHDAIDALEIVATGKADAEHTHEVSEVNNLQSSLDALNTRINTLTPSDIGAATDEHIHSDINLNIANLQTNVSTLASTVVYIDDISDSLTDSATNKPLSAKQGVVLKGLIDDIAIPTKTSELTNDSNFIGISTTTADNGKFLRVVDGTPAWFTITSAEGSGF